MKRIVVYLLIASLLCLAAVSFAVVEEPRNPETQVYQVTTPKGQLNVRSRPDAGSKVVGKLSNRSFVKALSQEGGFYQVQLEKEQTGWVAAEFLTPTAYGEEVLTFRPMQIGSKGKDVAKLKERLLSLGYYRDNFSMSDSFNATCVVRVRLFQKLNGLEETGIATPLMQAVLFSAQAKENTGEIPVVKRTFVAGPHSHLFQTDGFDWNKFDGENPRVCMCCLGKGCECCNFTGRID